MTQIFQQVFDKPAAFLALLLPALFPSWRFFREVGPGLRVERRLGQGAWSEVIPRAASVSPRQMVLRLLWNPRGNQRLYLVSLAERLLSDPTPYVEAELTARTARGLAPGAAFAWRIVLVDAAGAEVAFESGPCRVGAGRA